MHASSPRAGLQQSSKTASCVHGIHGGVRRYWRPPRHLDLWGHAHHFQLGWTRVMECQNKALGFLLHKHPTSWLCSIPAMSVLRSSTLPTRCRMAALGSPSFLVQEILLNTAGTFSCYPPEIPGSSLLWEVKPAETKVKHVMCPLMHAVNMWSHLIAPCGS